MARFYIETKPAGQSYKSSGKYILELENCNKIKFASEAAMISFAQEAKIKLEKTLPNNDTKPNKKYYLDNFS